MLPRRREIRGVNTGERRMITAHSTETLASSYIAHSMTRCLTSVMTQDRSHIQASGRGERIVDRVSQPQRRARIIVIQ